ncbi:protein of unknown function [Parapedobacter composti]|uniref:DUF4397 domain-containing protein n=2 Tax=Sphingobacteriaceae TaxID=84566 RepID=A0A1I1FBS1_9SPHI|nr:protein of unknown function [Parapedobacter composti]
MRFRFIHVSRMEVDKNLSPIFYLLFVLGAIIIGGCSKADLIPKPEAKLSFFNGSFRLIEEVKSSYNKPAFIHLLDEYGERTKNNEARFDQIAWDVFPSGRLTIKDPLWQTFMRIDPGDYKVLFHDTDSIPLVSTDIRLNDQQRYMIYLVDSLRHWRTYVTDDNILPENGIIRLRMVHLSPDAGPICIQINKETVWCTQHYLDDSGFLTIVPKADSQRMLIEVLAADDLNKRYARYTSEFYSGHNYTAVFMGHSNQHPAHDQQADAQISIIRNN